MLPFPSSLPPKSRLIREGKPTHTIRVCGWSASHEKNNQKVPTYTVGIKKWTEPSTTYSTNGISGAFSYRTNQIGILDKPIQAIAPPAPDVFRLVAARSPDPPASLIDFSASTHINPTTTRKSNMHKCKDITDAILRFYPSVKK
jgi:hypothetical protein